MIGIGFEKSAGGVYLPNRQPDVPLRLRHSGRSTHIRDKDRITPQSQKQVEQIIKNGSIIKARASSRKHFSNQDTWKPLMLQTGKKLFLFENGTEKESIAFNKDNEWFPHGRSRPYGELKDLLKIFKIHRLRCNFTQPFSTNNDHIFPIYLRILADLHTKFSRAIITSAGLNAVKETANKTVNALTISEYCGMNLEQALTLCLDSIDENMWNKFYSTDSDEFVYVQKENIDVVLVESYRSERGHALAEMPEMLSFVVKLGINEGPNAAIIIFVLMRLITMLENVRSQIANRAIFEKECTFIRPAYLVESVEELYITLGRAIVSVEDSLSIAIKSNAKKRIRRFVNIRLQNARDYIILNLRKYVEE